MTRKGANHSEPISNELFRNAQLFLFSVCGEFVLTVDPKNVVCIPVNMIDFGNAPVFLCRVDAAIAQCNQGQYACACCRAYLGNLPSLE